jgi:hypothetical protein
MNLSSYVDNLRYELAVAASAGGEDARELAERLTAPLESAIRLTLLNALSAAADEITRDLAPGSVEVRLRGLDPTFVVKQSLSEQPAESTAAAQPAPSAVVVPAGDDGATSRINLRLPDHLKQRVEEVSAREGLSVNAWLVRAAATALEPATPTPRGHPGRGAQQYTGWVR